jgi:perosamine synthetase
LNSEKKYRIEIAKQLHCSYKSIFLFWKGRVALYTALKAIGVSDGEEVVLQAFTCVVVPNAIIYTGATPIYTDVRTDTYNMSLESVKAKVTDKTKVVIIQNTFGLSSEVEEIVAFCKSKEIYCVEDCTHGFGGTYNGKSNGSMADFAFYSTQWNKPFSTGVGGILRVNNHTLLNKVKELVEDAVKPSSKEGLVLRVLITARKYLLNDATYWILIRLYRKLTARKLVVGSSDPEEIQAPILPQYFLKKSAPVQCSKGIQALAQLPKVNELRKRNALLFDRFLKSNGKRFVPDEFKENHYFLIYPLLVKNRFEFMLKAENKGLPLGDWFISPIHPVQENFEQWQLNPSDFPNALYLSKHILNIPLDKDNVQRYLTFLQENIDQII